MKPAAFDYLRPASLDEALALLARGGEGGKLLAGGQSLAPMMNMRLAQPKQLVDVNDLSELAYVREQGGWIEVGALTRHHQVAGSDLLRRQCPLLAEAAATIGHYAIRQRGTLGGSLAHADPAAQFVLAAVTLDARLALVSGQGRREVAAREFFLAPMTTDLRAGEMIVAARFPRARPGEGAALRLFSRRRGDYAIVAVAATVRAEGGQVADLRLGLAGATPMPQSVDAGLGAFIGAPLDGDWPERAAAALRDRVNPPDDARIPPTYRRELTGHLVAAALRAAAGSAIHRANA